MTRFGEFDDAAREYVISRPDTPLPWINYLGSEDFFGIISNTAGGYSFFRDARMRRLTRYRYNTAVSEAGGRHLYLRDAATGDVWSPSWQPTRAEVEDYRCRHGLGYTVIGSRRTGIEVETLYFVPLGETVEVWRTRITNHRNTVAQLSLFSAVEFCLWDASDDATNLQRNLSIGEVEVDGSVIYHTTEYRERRNHFAYFACSSVLSGFDTARDRFLGPHRGWDRPLVVEQGQSGNSIAHGWAPCGSHHVELTLEPGDQREIVFLLGYAENPADAKFDPPGSSTVDTTRAGQVIRRLLGSAEVEAAFGRLREHWSDQLGALQISTPSEHADRMVNIWNPYQCMATFNLSRSASLFETGLGRGMGFRDSNQDLLGFVHMVPDRARQRIVDIAATQLPSGGAYHQYQPLTKRGNDAIGSGFNDDPLWLILAVAAYVKETGERGILDEPVPFDNEPGSESTLYEHLQRSVQYTLDRLGPHGLPLIGRADWNDCLNLNCFSETPGESFQTTENREGGVAESVFIAALFTLAADELAQIAQHHGRRRRDRAVPVRARRDGRGGARPRLGRAVVPPRLRLLRGTGGLGDQQRRPDLHRAAGDVRHGWDRERRRAGPVRPGFGRLTAGHGTRRHAAAARVHELPPRARRDQLLPTRLQGERERVLPHEPVDHDRRGAARQGRPSLRLLLAHQPVGPRAAERCPPM